MLRFQKHRPVQARRVGGARGAWGALGRRERRRFGSAQLGPGRGQLGVAQTGLQAFTGAFGSREQAATSAWLNAREVHYQSTRELRPREGLSVVLTWSKGRIAEPDAGQRLRWFLSDNGAALVLLLGLGLCLAWYLLAWRRVGRDPEKGVIIPRFKSPDGLSPAASRYVLDMSFNRHVFTAAIISPGRSLACQFSDGRLEHGHKKPAH